MDYDPDSESMGFSLELVQNLIWATYYTYYEFTGTAPCCSSTLVSADALLLCALAICILFLLASLTALFTIL